MKAGACRDGACLKAGGGYACHEGTFGAGAVAAAGARLRLRARADCCCAAVFEARTGYRRAGAFEGECAG